MNANMNNDMHDYMSANINDYMNINTNGNIRDDIYDSLYCDQRI